MAWKLEEAQQNFPSLVNAAIEEPQLIYNQDQLVAAECIPLLQVCPHPPTPSPKKGEGEPDWKSLSRSGRGI